MSKATKGGSHNGTSKFKSLNEALADLKKRTQRTPLEMAVDFLSSGCSDMVAGRKICEAHGICMEQAQAVIESAYKKITEGHSRAPEHKLALALEQRSKIVAAAFENEDYRTALAAMEQREKLLGLGQMQDLQGAQAATTLLALMEAAVKSGGEGTSDVGQ